MGGETPPVGVGFVIEVTGKDILNKLEALSVAMNEGFLKVDGIPKDVADHEVRIRVLEQRPYIKPAAVYAALALLAPTLAVFVTIVIALRK